MRHSKKGGLYLSARRRKNRGENLNKKSLPKVTTKNDQGPFPVENEILVPSCSVLQTESKYDLLGRKKGHSKKGGLYLSAKRKKNRGQNLFKKSLSSNANPLENEVLLPDCGTSQALQFKANDTPVHLDANITVPYIKQEIIEPVVSQNLQCHTLSQELVEPVISQTLPCHNLSQSFSVASSSCKSKVINITKRSLHQKSPIDLPYDAVCTESIEEPVPNFLPEKRRCIVKKNMLLSTDHNGKTADSCGVKRSDVGRSAKKKNVLAGKRFMTLGEANCTSNKLHKTRFTYLSSQRKPKPQLGQTIKNSLRNLLIMPAVPHEASHTFLSGELIPPEKIKVEDEFEVVENEFHDSPEAVISSLNQEKWNSTLSGTCLNPVTPMIVRSPSTQWFTNSCTSAVTTETVTTFASTSDKTVCTSTSALSNACLSSTSTIPILMSSYAQPSIPSIQYVSSLPINPALNVPMILVPQWPAAINNYDLIFNPLSTQSNQSPSMVTNFPFLTNNLNNSSFPTRISDSSNINSSLPIQAVVLNPTINSTLCDTNLSSTLDLPDKHLSLKVENVLALFDKDAGCLPDRNNATQSDVDTSLSDTKSTTLSDKNSTTLSDMKSTSLSDSKSTSLSDSKSTSLSDSKITSLSDMKSTSLSDTKSTTQLNTKSTTQLNTKSTTQLNTKSTALLNTESTTLSVQKSTTLSFQKSTSLSDRISTTLCGRKNMTLSDRSNAISSDRSTTTLFDSILSNVPEQNTSMLSNRIATVSAVGPPSTALSSNNSAPKQDSLTITMPSYAASFVSKTVSNDEGSKEKIAFGEKAQQVLEEVTDKLSKILPDTSFVKYLTDPDFHFFIGLLPLIHMLSVQQKVHAQIIIKRILYDLAYPATSTSLATSN